MANQLRKDLSNTYNHFITYTINNNLFNILLTIIENIPILIALDFMWMDDYLAKIFSPLYYLAPHIYLDKLNTFFPNKCALAISQSAADPQPISADISNRTIKNIFRVMQMVNKTMNITSNATMANITSNSTVDPAAGGDEEEEEWYIPENTKIPIFFFQEKILELDNTFCIYSPTIMIGFYVIIFMIIFLFFFLGKFHPSDTKQSCLYTSIVFFITNFINLCTRPFGYLFFLTLFNYPIIMLYQSEQIIPQYFSSITVYSGISLSFFLVFIIFMIIFIKIFNNTFYYENYPYDYFSAFDSNKLLIIKIIMGLKFNFDRLIGFRFIMFVNYFLGTMMVIRMAATIFNRNLIINNLSQKFLRNFFSCFFCIYLTLKLLNKVFGLSEPTLTIKVTEIVLIAAVIIILFTLVLQVNMKYAFKDKDDLLNEILRFFYHNKKLLEEFSKQKSSWSVSGNKSNLIFL